MRRALWCKDERTAVATLTEYGGEIGTRELIVRRKGERRRCARVESKPAASRGSIIPSRKKLSAEDVFGSGRITQGPVGSCALPAVYIIVFTYTYIVQGRLKLLPINKESGTNRKATENSSGPAINRFSHTHPHKGAPEPDMTHFPPITYFHLTWSFGLMIRWPFLFSMSTQNIGTMGRKPKYLRNAAANARAARHRQQGSASAQAFADESEHEIGDMCAPEDDLGPGDTTSEALYTAEGIADVTDDSDCEYGGGVNECLPECSEEYCWTTDEEAASTSSDDNLSEFDEDMMEELKKELVRLAEPTPYEAIGVPKSSKNWAAVEKRRDLGYNGLGRSTQFRKAKNACDGAVLREKAKTS
ncbi:hypothetical protein C8J57DRAFT_1229568 [Mycena rebaudengoi]|nr:hypothetical protein C8J57DRAFT_1229568 [Mycena rebaudengoi]